MKYLQRGCHALFTALIILSAPASADSVMDSVKAQREALNQPMWPGVSYQAQIPTFSEVLGYQPGERISNHQQMVRYFHALQAAAPKRIKLFNYATSWEGRPLMFAAISSAQNMSGLDEFEQAMQHLSDPRSLNASQAKSLQERLPASVWLQYGVHGNEISSTDAAMFTAYHLLAAPQNAINQQILQNTIVFIDPLQNPDGRERFTSRYYATVGLIHSADRLSAEHNEPWPNGRSNHYLFDMNRDWLAITQPETQGRIEMLNRYRPLVVIDLHEMGGDESYYFAPAAQPVNPHMTKTQIANMSAIGRNHAKHFDDMGFDYFTREIFDAFYPGYGDSWPTFYGASASTYEVASARGHVFQKRNGELFTYRDSVQQHFVASISTAEAVAENRQKLLQDYYDYQVDTVNQGRKAKERIYILPNTRDRAGNHQLATLMARHGVEVHRAEEDFKACGENYTQGSYLIDTAQPRGRFVTTTFSAQVDMDEAFLKEQERRRNRNLYDEIYDVTGWSLPLLFNVDTATCKKVPSVKRTVVAQEDPLTGKLSNPDATVAYLVPWGDIAAVRFLTGALRAGLKMKSADKAFTLEGGKRYPAGTLIVEVRANEQQLHQQVANLVETSGAVVDGVNTSWVTQGPNFGSSNTPELMAPRIAMAWDEPTSSLSAGNTRFVIERQLGYPVTAIRSAHLVSADLSQYQVLVLPDGYYDQVLGKAGAENIKQWVNQGGVLVTLSGGTRFAAETEAGLLAAKREFAYQEEDNLPASKNSEKKQVPGSVIDEPTGLAEAIEPASKQPDWVAGVLANVAVDQEHWLTAGVHDSVIALVNGNDIYAPITLADGKNLAWFKAQDELLASGYLWQENKQQLAFKPFLIHQPLGKGMVVAFTQEPTFRAYMHGLNVMFANALFRSPAHAASLHH